MPGYRNTQNVQKMGPIEISLENDSKAKLFNFNSVEFCSIFDSNKDWIGNSHLNEFGAEKFTIEFIRVLRSHNILF